MPKKHKKSQFWAFLYFDDELPLLAIVGHRSSALEISQLRKMADISVWVVRYVSKPGSPKK